MFQTFLLCLSFAIMDPQSREWLDQVNGMTFNLETQPLALTRKQTEEFFAPSTIKLFSIKDIKISGPHGDIPLRIYSPLGVGPFPVVVYFHGGGWVVGSLNTADAIARQIASQSKVIVVSVDYRLAPENKFPMPLNDCYAATLWVSQNIQNYEGVPEILIVAGESAGGNLAAAVTLMAREKKKPQIQGQILINPVTRYAYYSDSYKKYGQGYFITQPMMEWFWKHYLSDANEGHNFLASPLFAKNLTKLPPALVILSQFDPLHDEGFEYGERLQAAGVPVKIVDYPTIHGFIGHPQLDITKKAFSDIQQFISNLDK